MAGHVVDAQLRRRDDGVDAGLAQQGLGAFGVEQHRPSREAQ